MKRLIVQRLKANADYRTLGLRLTQKKQSNWHENIFTPQKIQLLLTAGIAMETITMVSFIFFLASHAGVTFLHGSTLTTGNYSL